MLKRRSWRDNEERAAQCGVSAPSTPALTGRSSPPAHLALDPTTMPSPLTGHKDAGAFSGACLAVHRPSGDSIPGKRRAFLWTNLFAPFVRDGLRGTPTNETGRARTRQRLIDVSKTSQKTGLASAVRTLDREEARRIHEVGAVLCVVRSSEAFVVRSEALRSLAPLRVWRVLWVPLEQSLEYRRYHPRG